MRRVYKIVVEKIIIDFIFIGFAAISLAYSYFDFHISWIPYAFFILFITKIELILIFDAKERPSVKFV